MEEGYSLSNFSLVVDYLYCHGFGNPFWSIFAINNWSKVDKSRPVKKKEIDLPHMTVVLPTWNESIVIQGKLEDIRSQEYPDELLEVIVIDSATDDSTVHWLGNGLAPKERMTSDTTR